MTYSHFFSWDNLVEQVRNEGFEIIVNRKFQYGKDTPDFIVAAHRNKFLILTAASFILADGSVVVNSASVYGTVQAVGTPENREIFFGCSHGFNNHRCEFECDEVGSIFYNLKKIEAKFPYTTWSNPSRFLWLLDYTQDADQCDSQRDSFIATAPDWVKDFIIN